MGVGDKRYTLAVVRGEALLPYLSAVAALRIAVFREWPYLYDGSAAYEANYLHSYVAEPTSCVVLVHHQQQLIGASAALPLTAADPAFSQPFKSLGIDPAEVFYFGESVILPEWRGRGIGKAFFAERLKAAREYGSRIAAFCAVERPENHPLRPIDYRPLDAFWQSMGFAPEAGLKAKFSWREVPSGKESENTLQFWLLSFNH
jgi:GNAT superfamily N-acetyltransferase